MPRSKSKRVRYQPPPKKKPKASPVWFGPLILGLMLLGVLMIVLNYMQILPGTGGGARNEYLWGGLGLIAIGFLGATQWR
jgi:Cell division protein CrgA